MPDVHYNSIFASVINNPDSPHLFDPGYDLLRYIVITEAPPEVRAVAALPLSREIFRQNRERTGGGSIVNPWRNGSFNLTVKGAVIGERFSSIGPGMVPVNKNGVTAFSVTP